MLEQANQLDEGLDFVKSEVRILRIRVESGDEDLSQLQKTKNRTTSFQLSISLKGVEKAEKTSEETTTTVKIDQVFDFHIHFTVSVILIIKVAIIGDIIQVVKLERVVEELKEEIWELDTNNKFVLFIYYQHVTNKAVSIMYTNNRFLLSLLTHLPRNNLVFYGIREEAASSPEAAVRDVIKRKVVLFPHSVYSTIF